MFQITISEDNRIRFQNIRKEYVTIGFPEEYENEIHRLLNYCKEYRTPRDRALDELLSNIKEGVSDEVFLRIAPSYIEEEILPPYAVRVKEGKVVRADKRGVIQKPPIKEEPVLENPLGREDPP